MKILVTGFEPFGDEKINPSWEAVKMLPAEISGAEIIKMEVPTVFEESDAVVETAIIQYGLDAVICVGQAGGRTEITVEKVGINLMEASIPDNKGNKPIDEAIREDGPDGLFSTLPVKAIVSKMQSEGIPVKMSYTAGTYVCNNLLYALLHFAKTKCPDVKVGFIHVPFSCEQAVAKADGTFGMPIDMMAKGLELAIRALVEPEGECMTAMGETH